MDLKEDIKNFRSSSNFLLKGIYWFLKPFWTTIRLSRNKRQRAEFIAHVKKDKHQYQVSTFTELNRYPELFDPCSKFLQTIPSPKLLSFGCSTGEEAETLLSYMPNAIVTGVDINNWCLKTCREKFRNTAHFFCNRKTKTFEQLENFDAIFCLAVLQRTENRIIKEKNVATGITFDLFEHEIITLDSKLKSGGVFIIDNTDFNFEDTSVASKYIAHDFEENQILQDRPLFDRNNKKISDETFLHRMYIKK